MTWYNNNRGSPMMSQGGPAPQKRVNVGY